MVQEQVSNKCGIASEDISHVGGDGKDHPQRGVAPEGEGVGESAGLFGRSGGSGLTKNWGVVEKSQWDSCGVL